MLSVIRRIRRKMKSYQNILKRLSKQRDKNVVRSFGENCLTDDILSLYDIMVLPAAPKGMCGCIYTQLSDVEDEINGLYTYDRKVCKVDKERMLEMSKKLQEAVNA